ncbi:MAG: Trk system potassium transporter TrkA [Ruminococcus sp.]|nr:Trk system potassium transporter TrkA [Ruminococcus sp.]
MNIIVVGCGRVGRTIVRQLEKEGHSITIIDTDSGALQSIAGAQNVMTIEGNGATFDVLNDAGVADCDIMIAVTASDELNLYACLIAKNSGAPHTIARVRNPEYTNDVPKIKDELKLSLAINPEQTCARELSRLIKFPGAVEIDSFAKGVVDLIKVKIRPDSVLADRKVVDCASLFKEGLRICTVERGKECFIPNGNFEIKSGDIISIISESNAAAKLFKNLGVINSRSRHVIILGGSKIAFYLAKSLAETGIKVKIIENNLTRCEELADLLSNVVIIHGNAMNQELLVSEGIEHADAVVALMNTDEENIIVSLFAKDVNPDAKIITEIDNLSFSIIDSLPLDSVIHPKHLTGQYIIQYVRAMQNSVGSNIETLYSICNDQAEALEFKAREESMAIGVPLAMLSLKPELQVVCIMRNGKIIIPTGKDSIELGDSVIIVTKHTGLFDLKDILK